MKTAYVFLSLSQVRRLNATVAVEEIVTVEDVTKCNASELSSLFKVSLSTTPRNNHHC